MDALVVAPFALFLALNVYVLRRAKSIGVLLLLGLSYNYLLQGYVVGLSDEA